MAYDITVDTSDILDGERIDADDVLIAITDLEEAIEALGAIASIQLADGRLTLSSGTPVTTADVTAATSIYYCPYRGNRISLYDGSAWQIYTFSELTLSLSGLTASLPHDVFIYLSSGVLTLQAVAWTNTTTRATNLQYQDGVYCMNGTLTKRYLGTFYTTATGQTEDSHTKRMVWNMFNKVRRALYVTEAANSWTYATATFRSFNNSTTNRVEFVRGISEDSITLNFMAWASHSAGATAVIGIGLDATNADSSQAHPGHAITSVLPLFAAYEGTPAAGYHYLQLIELATGATITYYGDNNLTYIQSGATGTLAA